MESGVFCLHPTGQWVEGSHSRLAASHSEKGPDGQVGGRGRFVVDLNGQDIVALHQPLPRIEGHVLGHAALVQLGLVKPIGPCVEGDRLVLHRPGAEHFVAVDEGHAAVIVVEGQQAVHQARQIRQGKRPAQVDHIAPPDIGGVIAISVAEPTRRRVPGRVIVFRSAPIARQAPLWDVVPPQVDVAHRAFPMVDGPHIAARGEDDQSLRRTQRHRRQWPLVPFVRVIREPQAGERCRLRPGVPHLDPVLLLAEQILDLAERIDLSDQDLTGTVPRGNEPEGENGQTMNPSHLSKLADRARIVSTSGTPESRVHTSYPPIVNPNPTKFPGFHPFVRPLLHSPSTPETLQFRVQ